MFLLDTNALLAAMFRPERLGKQTSRLIKDSDEIHYSPLSLSELAMKHMAGKLKLDTQIHLLVADTKFKELALRSEVLPEVYSLSSLVKHDPFDRLILASARANRARLITSDRKLLDLGFDWVWDSSQ